jgi:hypothetical protein
LVFYIFPFVGFLCGPVQGRQCSGHIKNVPRFASNGKTTQVLLASYAAGFLVLDFSLMRLRPGRVEIIYQIEILYSSEDMLYVFSTNYFKVCPLYFTRVPTLVPVEIGIYLDCGAIKWDYIWIGSIGLIWVGFICGYIALPNWR